MTARLISEAVDRRSNEIVETLRDLVRIPTQTPPGQNYDVIVDRLLPEFTDLGFSACRHDIPAEIFERRSRTHYQELQGVRANLLATLPSEKPRMAFYCHLDTVPVGDSADWSVKPFDAVEEDGWVWGRGTADSKGGVAAILSAFRVLRELEIEPAVSPIIALTTDEEIGPYTGLMHMVDVGIFDGCSTFVSVDGMATTVGVGLNGGFTWKITVHGTSVHSATSFLGLNPIEHSLALISELVALKDDVDTRRSSLPVSPEVASATGRTHLSPVLNITIAHGGTKHNVVPSQFVIEGDRRFLPEEDETACIEELQSAIDRARAADPNLDCDLIIKPFYTSFASDPEDPWVKGICTLASDIRGYPVVAAGLNGSSDVAYVGRHTAMKIAINGLVRDTETNHHAPDERCKVDDLLAVTKIVATLAADAKWVA